MPVAPKTNTMTMFNTSGNAVSNIENKEYHERQLLEDILDELVVYKLGNQIKVPKNRGNIMSWRKLTPLPTVDKPLVEGVTPDPVSFGYVEYKMTTEQYGQYTEFTDVVANYAIDDVIADGRTLLSRSGAESIEKLVIKELYKAPNVLSTSGKLSVSLLNYIKSVYRKNRVRPLSDGSYVAVVSEEQLYDLKESTEPNSWLEVGKYADPKSVLNGEVGKLAGFRFVSSNFVEVGASVTASEDPAYTHNSAFATGQGSKAIFLGADAFAVTALTGNTIGAPTLIWHGFGSAGSDAALDQKATLGWKLDGFGVRINRDEAVMIVETSTGVLIPTLDTIITDEERTHYSGKTDGKTVNPTDAKVTNTNEPAYSPATHNVKE